MPNPITKSRQALKARFVRNAIPTQQDFADLIDASLSQAEDGLFKLPDQPLSLVRQRADQPLLRFYADPAAEGSAWQLQLTAGDKPCFGLTGADGKLALVVDGKTGNVGVGLDGGAPAAKLHVAGSLKLENSLQLGRDQEILFADNGQIRSADGNHRLMFRRAENKMELREYGDIVFSPGSTAGNETAMMVLDARGNLGIGTQVPGTKLHLTEQIGTPASAKNGSLLIDHDNEGGASSIVFRSKVDRGSDYAYIEYRENSPDAQLKEPSARLVEAGLLKIGCENDGRDHIALMASGNVGVGTTTPERKFHVNGTTMLAGDTTLTGKLAMTGDLLLRGSLLLNDINILTRIFSFDQGDEALIFFNSSEPSWRSMCAAGSKGPRSITMQKSFASGNFTRPPVVLVSISGFDTACSFNQRVNVYAVNVSAAGFSIKVDTWGDTLLYSVKASWLAFGI